MLWLFYPCEVLAKGYIYGHSLGFFSIPHFQKQFFHFNNLCHLYRVKINKSSTLGSLLISFFQFIFLLSQFIIRSKKIPGSTFNILLGNLLSYFSNFITQILLPSSKPATENIPPVKSPPHFESLLPGRAQTLLQAHLMRQDPLRITLLSSHQLHHSM